MIEDRQDKPGQDSKMADVFKSTADFWSAALKMWPDINKFYKHNGQPGPAAAKPEQNGRLQDTWQSALGLWQTFFSAMGEPETVDSALKSLSTAPAVLLKMAQTSWNGYSHLLEQWIDKASQIGQKTEAYQFENLDHKTFEAWMEIYQKDLQQYLNMPQLGLTRVYQERVNQLSDKFNILQGVAAKFLYLLYLPIEKSFQVMQDKVKEMTDKGSLPKKAGDFYQLWVKILEGHYMTLMKSPDYTQALAEALNAFEDYLGSRDQVIQDVLKGLPIPTNQDMDELYKEIYILKKRVKDLEKRKER
ncbi:MAG: hypothetical protein HQK60_01590 [Deltaproteobacteria bacterium]|nr:hypothetical protein [Deltaproteobacteria bacterium]